MEPLIIDISDAYVNWLCLANATAGFHRGNLYCFDYAIRNLPSEAPIVEIGSFCGLSTNLLTYYKTKYERCNLLITCDKWQFEGAQDNIMVGESSISHLEYRTFIKDIYIRNIRMFSRNDLPFTIEMTSDEFFASWQKREKVTDVLGRPIQLGGPISLCSIDGNHSYEFVKRDFYNCHKLLESGGFCFFDDSHEASGFPDVGRLVTEIKASGGYEVAANNPNYLFRKK